ncbi:serine hydrolase [bacterium]|nr:serine hydrolase [bacterium]
MKRINMSLWQAAVSVIIAMGVGLIISYAWSNYYHSGLSLEEETGQKGEVHQSGYSYISPLLECADIHDIRQNDLEKKIKEVINKNIGQGNITYASVYFRDLNNGPWIGINEQEKFTPASLLKVPLMIAYLKLAEEQSQILNDRITIENEVSNLSQNILPLKHVDSGQDYTIDDLIKYMIIYSDNGAAGALMQHMNPEYLNKIYRDLGIAVPNSDQMENFMNVKDYASFFRILYNASYLNREMSEKALEILSQSQFDKGLKAGIPANIAVSHKFGERVWLENKQLHDCGIIYLKQSPYLLCIMTRGDDFNKMGGAIRDLSTTVYENFK